MKGIRVGKDGEEFTKTFSLNLMRQPSETLQTEDSQFED